MFSFVAYVVYFLVELRLQRASLSFVAKESKQRKASPAGGLANMCFAPVVQAAWWGSRRAASRDWLLCFCVARGRRLSECGDN